MKYPDQTEAPARKPTTNRPITTVRTTVRTTPRTTRFTTRTTTTTESNIDNELENQSPEVVELEPEVPSVDDILDSDSLEPFDPSEVRCNEGSDFVASRDCTKVN